jgi:hypothetical protein
VADGALPDDTSGRPGGAPFVRRPSLSPRPQRGGEGSIERLELLRTVIGKARRGVIVAGRDGRHAGRCSAGGAVAAFAAAAGWPLLADPLSGARRGAGALADYDALLRDVRLARSRGPTSSCASAACPYPSRCEPGSPDWPTCHRWRSTPSERGRTPPRCCRIRWRSIQPPRSERSPRRAPRPPKRIGLQAGEAATI